MSLSLRLILLVLLAIVPILGIEIYGAVELRASRQQDIRATAINLMRQVAAEQERIGEGTRQLLIAFSEVPPARAGDWGGCNQTAQRIGANIEGYINLGIANLAGELLCSAIAAPPGFDFRRNPVFDRVRPDTELAVGSYQVGRLTGARQLTYAIPWRDDKGAMIGIVFAALDLTWLAKHFADRFTSPDMTLLIADRAGTILARLPDNETWVGQPIGTAFMPLLTAPQEGVVDAVGIDGEERFIAYSPLAFEPRDIYLGVGIAKAPLLAAIDAATRRTALLISLALGLALIAAWLGGGAFIRRPIGALLVATRRWQDGDSSARARLADHTSEIGKLGRAFDAMADALEGRERQRRAAEDALARLNAELEQRVKEEVAEREKAQAALVQAQRIEAVGQLTSGVAHDFNNLLAAVLGNLELLGLRLTDPRSQQLLDGAARAAGRGAKLTEQLLAFSRHRHHEPEPFDVNHLIQGMSELLARTLGPSIVVSRAFAADLWPALADQSQVEIALLNLAVNARDAMPLGGTLLIETANVPVGHRQRPPDLAGDCVMVAVSDTGTGMTPEVQARAFEPFYTTKEVGKGTGLGLSMVYGVAKQSGGAAAIESAPGKGTTVALFLPRSAVPPAAALHEVVAEIKPGHAGSTVLVVDDDRDVREVTVAALTEAGLAVTVVDSGRAALDRLEGGAGPDLMIVDYAMPGLNGAAVIARARLLRAGLPVILVTGYAEAGLATDLPTDVQLLRKPFRIAELLARVNAALAAAPARSA